MKIKDMTRAQKKRVISRICDRMETTNKTEKFREQLANPNQIIKIKVRMDEEIEIHIAHGMVIYMSDQFDNNVLLLKHLRAVINATLKGNFNQLGHDLMAQNLFRR